MQKAAPPQVFGALAQSGLYRVAMNVVDILYELRMIANVEVVVALLPEVAMYLHDHLATATRNKLLQILQNRAAGK